MSRHFGTDVADDLGDNFPKCGESSEEETSEKKIAFRLAICKDGSRCFMPVNDGGIKAAVTSGRFSIGMVVWIVVAVLAAISLVCCSISCATRRSSAVTTRSLASESIVTNDTALSEPVELAVSDSNSVNTDIDGKNESVAGALDALVTEKTEGGTNHGI